MKVLQMKVDAKHLFIDNLTELPISFHYLEWKIRQAQMVRRFKMSEDVTMLNTFAFHNLYIYLN